MEMFNIEGMGLLEMIMIGIAVVIVAVVLYFQKSSFDETKKKIELLAPLFTITRVTSVYSITSFLEPKSSSSKSSSLFTIGVGICFDGGLLIKPCNADLESNMFLVIEDSIVARESGCHR